jgi:hypothetical protein
MAYSGHAVFENYGIYTIVRNNISHNEPWYPQNPGPCDPKNPAVYTNSNYNGLYSHRNWQITDTFGRDKSFNLYEGNRIGHAGINPNNDGATNLTIAAPGNIVRYNALYNAMHNNMKTKYGENYGWQASGGCRNKIYNNTLYVSGYGYPNFENSFPWPRPMRGFRYYAPHDNPGNIFKNNIVYGSYAGDHGDDDIQSNTSNPASIEINNWTTNDGNGSSGYGDPLFVNPDLTQTASGTLPDLQLQSNSPAIDGGIHLTQTVGSGNNSTTLVVEDAFYFQDGTWGCDLAGHQADWIAIGSPDNIVQIFSINYNSNTIYLTTGKTWGNGDGIWLYKKSDGVQVLHGTAPDYGAYEYYSGGPPTGGVNDDANSLQIKEYMLSQNYPNPFSAGGAVPAGRQGSAYGGNPQTTITYKLPAIHKSTNEEIQSISISNTVSVSLKIYNILGKEVTTLVNQQQRPGLYEVTWDASHLPSGVYFYQLRAGKFIQVKKMILMK